MVAVALTLSALKNRRREIFVSEIAAGISIGNSSIGRYMLDSRGSLLT